MQAHQIGIKVATVTGYPGCQKQLKEDYNVNNKINFYFVEDFSF